MNLTSHIVLAVLLSFLSQQRLSPYILERFTALRQVTPQASLELLPAVWWLF